LGGATILQNFLDSAILCGKRQKTLEKYFCALDHHILFCGGVIMRNVRLTWMMSFLLCGALLVVGCRVNRTYPVDGRNFSPVDRFLARATPVLDDCAGSLNPYVLKVIDAYPLGIESYPYRCKPLEYDVYLGATQTLYYKGQAVTKAHPNNTRCSYCCGLTFEIFVRAMKLRNIQKGVDPDDFNGMTFTDLFNLLQIWYIEGEGDSPQRGIEYYGLGRKISDWEEAEPGDFCDFSRNNGSGHSVIFIGWERDPQGKIVGMEYFSSNSRGVGYLTEYFSDSGGKVLREWVRLARVGSIKDYKPFDRSKIPVRKAYAP
jgi:hypothetical protein